MGRFGSTD